MSQKDGETPEFTPVSESPKLRVELLRKENVMNATNFVILLFAIRLILPLGLLLLLGQWVRSRELRGTSNSETNYGMA